LEFKDANKGASAKKRVGVAAAGMVPDGAVVGLGTGSTAAFAIEEIGRRIREENFRCVGVPTSFQATILSRRQNIPLVTLDEISRIDVAIDGADEVDPRKNLIKGGGAAHTHEKIVASFADKFIVVVDYSKLVKRLGEKWAVPVEVIPFAYGPVMKRFADMGAHAELRMAVRKDGPVISDEGNFIIDVRFDDIADPAQLEKEINTIPGVLENGIFADKADLVLIAPNGDGEIEKME